MFPSNERQVAGRVLTWLPLLFVFPVLGYLVGWLVGSSQTPVVATLLPLVFALFGALSFRSLSHSQLTAELLASVESLDNASRKELLQALAKPSSLRVASFWAVGVICFSASCLVGTRHGIHERIPEYPSLELLLAGSKPDPREAIQLNLLRWHLQYRGVPAEDCENLFRLSINPILREESIRVLTQDGIETYVKINRKTRKPEIDDSPQPIASLRHTQILEAVRTIQESKSLPAPDKPGPRGARVLYNEDIEPLNKGHKDG